jgi:hypothetical protein
MAGRDMNATWRSAGTLCRDLDWSKRRLIYELQNGLPYRTIPPGQVIDWHSAATAQNFSVEASEVTIAEVPLDGNVLLAFTTVGIELLWPPSGDAPKPTTESDSGRWAIAATRNLQAENKIPNDTTKAGLARLLEIEAQKAVRAGQIRRALKASYLENQLVPWGIWPLSSFE